jgi:hypothetical protein
MPDANSSNTKLLTEQLLNKWAPVLNHKSMPKIGDHYRQVVTAMLLENQKQDLQEAVHANNIGGGQVGTWDPVLISLVRRSAPNLIAFDICGVQPMTGPTGLVFALRATYGTQGTTAGNGVVTATEALFDEADTDFSGAASPAHAGTDPFGTFTTGGGLSTLDGENLGDSPALNQMSFRIDKTTVTAKTRGLKGEYTTELQQDLKAIHGLDAETELTNILSNEILAEQNREVIRRIITTAVPGAQKDVVSPGTFDLNVDASGRWSVERFKGLLYQIEREANSIAKATRRGKGNFILCSSDVASALSMAGVLDYAPALSTNLNVDDTGNTFAGTINGRTKVYIDPYFSSTTHEFFVSGYKGTSPYDAGFFYCPYVPLQLVRTVDPATFQPKIGFKTRYGLAVNPFTDPAFNKHSAPGTVQQNNEPGAANTNIYYRKVKVTNLL